MSDCHIMSKSLMFAWQIPETVLQSEKVDLIY